MVHGVGPSTANADNFYYRQIASPRVQHSLHSIACSRASPVYPLLNQLLTASTIHYQNWLPCTFNLRSKVTVFGREV